MTRVVVVGAWNPAIIQPPWLFQSRVVEEIPNEVIIEVNPRTRQFRFKLGPLTWTIDDNRMRIQAGELRDCGIFAARVLALLPHTPVDAVDTYFVYHCSEKEWPNEFVPALGNINLQGRGDKFESFEQFGWTGVRSIDSGMFHLSVTQRTASDVVISCRLHRNVDTAAKAAEFAGAWKRDNDVVRDTLASSFGISTHA